MPLGNNFEQQQIFRRLWANHSKQFIKENSVNYMLVRGTVLGDVEITDICRRVPYGECQMFTQQEIELSKDLKEATDRGWLKIIKGCFPIKHCATATQLDSINRKFNKEESMTKEEITRLAQEMAKTMAYEMSKEMLKNHDSLKEIIKDLATEMKQKLDEKVIAKEMTKEEEKLVLEDSKIKDIFIDVNEKDVIVTPNISSVGKIEEQKEDISGSLEKMKQFKRRKVGNG